MSKSIKELTIGNPMVANLKGNNMEEQKSIGWYPLPTPTEIALTKLEGQHTFIVTLPNNDRREVKATYMEVDGGSLYFENEDRETILVFAPGHWIWAERMKE